MTFTCAALITTVCMLMVVLGVLLIAIFQQELGAQKTRLGQLIGKYSIFSFKTKASNSVEFLQNFLHVTVFFYTAICLLLFLFYQAKNDSLF